MATRGGPHNHLGLPMPELRRGDTALMVIDVQYHGAHRDFGLLRERIDAGDEASIAYFADRIERQVVPNIQALQAAFRDAGIEIVHVAAQSLTADGRERGPNTRRHGKHVAPGTREAAILDEIAPVGDELVVHKTCSGVFNCTNIDQILHKLGIRTLVVAGIVTDSCVELAVRDAADRDFSVVVAEDATAAWTAEVQDATMDRLRDRTAKIVTTQDVIARIGVTDAADGHGQPEPAPADQHGHSHGHGHGHGGAD